MMQVVALPAMLIKSRPDGRAVDRSRVRAIAASIKEVGLLNPIVVRAAKRIRNGQTVDGWEILAGQHRFAAMSDVLGYDEIPSFVSEAGDLLAQIITIDENLARRDLSVAERAQNVARRKALYEQLHPETINGAVGRNHLQLSHNEKAERFTREAAQASGLSEATVARDARRGKELGRLLDRVCGTSLDEGYELDALIKLDPEAREALVRQAETGMRVSARTDAPSMPTFDRLDRAWVAASPAVRRAFYDRISLEMAEAACPR